MTSGALKRQYSKLGSLNATGLSWKDYKEANKHLLTNQTTTSTISLGSCVKYNSMNTEPTTAPFDWLGWERLCLEMNQPKDSTMNTVNNNQNERNELLWAIDRLEMNTISALHNKYVEPPQSPKTAKEIVEAIKAGNITLPKITDEDDENTYRWEPWKGIIWSKDWKADKVTYKKKREEFANEARALKLDVKIIEPVEALKKFRDLESRWTQ